MVTTTYLLLSIKVLSLRKWDSSLMLINQEASTLKKNMPCWGILKVQSISSGITNWLWLTHYLSILILDFKVADLIPSRVFVRCLRRNLCLAVFPVTHSTHALSPLESLHLSRRSLRAELISAYMTLTGPQGLWKTIATEIFHHGWEL